MIGKTYVGQRTWIRNITQLAANPGLSQQRALACFISIVSLLPTWCNLSCIMSMQPIVLSCTDWVYHGAGGLTPSTALAPFSEFNLPRSTWRPATAVETEQDYNQYPNWEQKETILKGMGLSWVSMDATSTWQNKGRGATWRKRS